MVSYESIDIIMYARQWGQIYVVHFSTSYYMPTSLAKIWWPVTAKVGGHIMFQIWHSTHHFSSDMSEGTS